MRRHFRRDEVGCISRSLRLTASLYPSSSFLTILFPIFASYKALRTSSLAQVAPWLMYWVVLSIVMLAESWTYFIIGWYALKISIAIHGKKSNANCVLRRYRIPFYSWLRLFALSYLVLPQTQGATRLYLEQVEPFLVHHEREIEHFISRTHERAKSAGLQQLYRLIDLVRERVLGLPPAMAVDHRGGSGAAPPPGGAASYAQAILSRFSSLPNAAAPANVSGPASDLYSLLSSALGTATGGAGRGAAEESRRDLRDESPSRIPGIFPQDIASGSRAEQAQYISSLRRQLGYLMSVVDRQQEDLELDERESPVVDTPTDDDDLAYGTSYDDYDDRSLRKNRSDHSFQNIDRDDLGVSSGRDREGEYFERRRRRG